MINSKKTKKNAPFQEWITACQMLCADEVVPFGHSHDWRKSYDQEFSTQYAVMKYQRAHINTSPISTQPSLL